jgi:Fic family protein
MLSIMKWNWQQPDWPDFRWSAARMASAEQQFLVNGGVLIGNAEHLDEQNQSRLRIEAVTAEAITTSAIEGEILDRDSVQSSIRRQLGLATDGRRVAPAEQGIAELMVDLYQNSAGPLDCHTLERWHGMVCRGRQDLENVGSYRTHKAPMQVVSGKIYDPVIHFEAPPSSRVPQEMERFLEWLASTASTGPKPLPPLTRAAIAHLYFVSIHPFEDGNGRMARAISERVLMQGLGKQSFMGIANTILVHQAAYYQALEAANKSNQINDWVAWMGGIILEAQLRSQAQVDFLIQQSRFFDRLHDQLNARQHIALIRMFREGPSGFTGGLSAGNYVSITKASTATATRDLSDLVEKNALRRTGEKRSTRYHLAIPAHPIPKVSISEDGEILYL